MNRIIGFHLCSIGILAFVGCGSSPNHAADIAGLKGNWLLTGTLPTDSPTGLRSGEPFSLTVTLDVVDGQLYANESYYYPCTANGAVGGAGGLETVTISPEGSFTLQAPPAPSGVPAGPVVKIEGTAPTSSGANWTGSYTANYPAQGCTSMSGTFTATPIQPVNGTFNGSTQFGPNGSTTVPITLGVVLQQGGPASLDPPITVSTVNSVSALSGTIQVAGSPCFTSGTAAIPSGALLGDSLGIAFAMNDGSEMFLSANIENTETTSLLLRNGLVSGGKCNGWFIHNAAALTRQ